MTRVPLIGELALRILARLSSDASLLRLQIRTDAPAHRRLWLPSGDRRDCPSRYVLTSLNRRVPLTPAEANALVEATEEGAALLQPARHPDLGPPTVPWGGPPLISYPAQLG